MIELKQTWYRDVAVLTEIQIRTFVDDYNQKPSGCSLEGPPGYNSLVWNAHTMEHTPSYKILFDGQIIGGLIIFDLGDQHFEMDRIWNDQIIIIMALDRLPSEKCLNYTPMLRNGRWGRLPGRFTTNVFSRSWCLKKSEKPR
jgi:hypothetical protein